MPTMVTSSTSQSSEFMRTNVKTPRAARRRQQRKRKQKGKSRATCESPALPEIRYPLNHRTAMASFSERDQIGEKSIRARHSRGQFPKKHQAGVNEVTFSVLRNQQSAGFRI